MARFRRKDLKRDRFVEEVTHQVEYFSGHRKQIIGGGVAVVVVLLASVGYWSYSKRRAADSSAALQEAIDLYHGVVSTEPRPGLKTFATEAERTDEVTRALDAVMLDYAGTAAAAGASFYSGLLDREQGNDAEAQSHFEQATRGKGREYPSSARLALGALLLESGDAESARQHFEALAEDPSRTVSNERASLELARTYLETDPAKAREILSGIESANGPSSALAAALLETLGDGS